MANNTPTTFVDLYTDAIQRVRENTSNTTVVDIMKRFINQANHDMHLQQNWWWAERRAYVQTKAQYTTGTATVTGGSAAVTGSGTAWNTATGFGWNNVNAGDKFQQLNSGDVYSIKTVNSDTSLTLDQNFIPSAGGVVASSGTYLVFSDEYSLAADFWRTIDLRQFTTAFTLPIITRSEFYRRFPRNNTTSLPQVCTIIDLASAGSTARVPKLVLHPPPDKIYNIPYRYQTTFLAETSAGVAQVNLVNDTDEPIMPLRYRNVLVYWAIAEWYRDRKDDTRSAEARSAYEDLLRRIANDSEPERDHPRIIMRTWQYKAGVAGRVRTGHSRFTTGRRWDELRD